MHLHILGIGGTFMGGVAALARELGLEVEGSDANIYPPMSGQLAALGIALKEGYTADKLDPAPDLVVVGNAMKRGLPVVEALLDRDLPYVSGPEWLGRTVLRGRETLAVAGTHGKTTTSSLLAHLLEQAGCQPGFLIGGVPGNFGISARLGRGAPFVIEADEYDTAFFDKRSKFVHYRPRIAILNNLEYDHADIFPDLEAIQRQFHHLLRTVPSSGRLIVNAHDEPLEQVLAMGCWTPVERFGIGKGDWQAELLAADGSAFVVHHCGQRLGEVHWSLSGRHNVLNALAALAAAQAAGVEAKTVLGACAEFRGVKRRMESLGEVGGVHVYDDFAHHPTAIATTLQGLRARLDSGRIVVALEPRSNSMRLGVHAGALAPALVEADEVVFLQRPELSWDPARVMAALRGAGCAVATVGALVAELVTRLRPGDHLVFMSNSGFEGAPGRLLEALRARS